MIAIASMAANRVIGNQNKIPWHSKEDFAFFREKTKEKNVIVGRTTFYDLPPLKGRYPYVVTSNMRKISTKSCELIADGIYPEIRYINPDFIHEYSANTQVCIGGAKTYELCLPYCDSLFLTIWDKEYSGDTIMPAFEHLFPLRRKVKNIEGGTIWEYLNPEKTFQEYKIIVDAN